MALHNGERVHWNYRGAVGHGTIVGVATKGTTDKTTRYKVKQTDNHPGEKKVLIHRGAALHPGKGPAKKENKSSSKRINKK